MPKVVLVGLEQLTASHICMALAWKATRSNKNREMSSFGISSMRISYSLAANQPAISRS